MSEAILESQLKQQTIQAGQVPIWNKVYVTLWLLVRNGLFWFLKK